MSEPKWRDRPREERAASINAHRAARAAAEQAGKVLKDECPATVELNALVIETEKHIPWWRR